MKIRKIIEVRTGSEFDGPKLAEKDMNFPSDNVARDLVKKADPFMTN